MIPKDLVYFVRDGDYNEELRYSLRSVAANLPHERVWIVGYTPKWVRGVRSIRGNLKAGKWLNVLDNLRIICEQVEADKFVVMNDDFFVMRPTKKLPPLYRGTLQEHLRKTGGHGSWRDSLLTTFRVLRQMGYPDPLSYELHVPVVMEREKLCQVVKVAEGVSRTNPPQWRTLYGNMFNVKAELARDSKVSRRRMRDPDSAFSSSDEASFTLLLRPQMNELFPNRCRYEEGGDTIAGVYKEAEDDMATFRTTVYPALAIRLLDRKFKFVGGRLRVSGEDIVLIEDFVNQHPEYKIHRVDNAPAPVVLESPAPNVEHPTLPELRKSLRAMGLPAKGTRDELEARLVVGYGEDVVYEGDMAGEASE